MEWRNALWEKWFFGKMRMEKFQKIHSDYIMLSEYSDALQQTSQPWMKSTFLILKFSSDHYEISSKKCYLLYYNFNPFIFDCTYFLLDFLVLKEI